jgi:hypothetical protein
MSWTEIKGNPGMGLEKQWIFRACNAPLCSLKPSREDRGGWSASLLNHSGISTVSLLTSGTLAQAQRACEVELRHMGWNWGPHAVASITT